jgi:hypothetical protein
MPTPPAANRDLRRGRSFDFSMASAIVSAHPLLPRALRDLLLSVNDVNLNVGDRCGVERPTLVRQDVHMSADLMFNAEAAES